MELGLQFGYGMIAHTKKLIEDWGGGRVVLSPRDLDETQLLSTSNAISVLGGTPYLDPQCYDRSSNHDRLNEHDYWTLINPLIFSNDSQDFSENGLRGQKFGKFSYEQA